MGEPALPPPSASLGYPALRPGARWTVSAGSVGISVQPEVGIGRMFFALDFQTTNTDGRSWWRPVRAGKAFVQGWPYRLRRGADTSELADFLERRGRR